MTFGGSMLNFLITNNMCEKSSLPFYRQCAIAMVNPSNPRMV